MEKETASGNEIEKGFSQLGCFAGSAGSGDIFLPVHIFRNEASSLESISKYLKDALGLKYCEIADILNRDDRTIWGAYSGSKQKIKDSLSVSDASVKVPVSIFKDRSLSVLEALAEYMKDQLNMRYCKIAMLLNKDQRTIWTVYKRAKRKRHSNGNNK